MRKFFTSFALAGALALTIAIGVASASHVGYHLFGEATIVAGEHSGQGNAVKLVSDSAPGYGGIDFDVPAGMTFAQLLQLATEYNVTDDDCGGGSPRFQLNIDGKNVFVYLGPSPTFTGCPPNTWVDSGNLIGNNDPCRYDTSQLAAGTQCNTYVGTLALLGSHVVTGIQLVIDSGWRFTDNEQTVLIDNTKINDTTYTYDEKGHPRNADDCKDGGWMDLVNDEGDDFKNQGDCVSYFNSTD